MDSAPKPLMTSPENEIFKRLFMQERFKEAYSFCQEKQPSEDAMDYVKKLSLIHLIEACLDSSAAVQDHIRKNPFARDWYQLAIEEEDSFFEQVKNLQIESTRLMFKIRRLLYRFDTFARAKRKITGESVSINPIYSPHF